MENLLEILKQLNIPQILVIVFAMWFFYNRLDNKISASEVKLENKISSSRCELENKIESRYEALNNRLDNLYQLIITIFNKKDAA